MRIFISLDAEGCSSLTRFSEVTPGSVEYGNGREAMLHDLKSVIAGIRSAGGDKIAVCDGHEQGGNLPLFGIDADYVIRGSGAPFSMMQGIEQGFDRIFFVGYHARAGLGGVMAHTYIPETVVSVTFDGCPVGEAEINAVLGLSFGAYPVFLSGDQVVTQETKKSFPSLATAVVKHAYSPKCAACFAGTDKLLEQTARQAMKAAILPGLAIVPKKVEVTYYDETVTTYNVQDYRQTFIEMLEGMRAMNKKRLNG